MHKIITESYGSYEAQKIMNFQPNEKALNFVIEASKDILSFFPNIPGSCVMMSALLTAHVRENTDYPIHMIVGSFYIDNHHIFGKSSTSNQTKNFFTHTNLDWDGHAWVIFGTYLIDLSIFRTAYSDKSPKILNEKILSKFGKNRGLIIAPITSMNDNQLTYEPHYAVKDKEITGLVRGAFKLIEE